MRSSKAKLWSQFNSLGQVFDPELKESVSSYAFLRLVDFQVLYMDLGGHEKLSSSIKKSLRCLENEKENKGRKEKNIRSGRKAQEMAVRSQSLL